MEDCWISFVEAPYLDQHSTAEGLSLSPPSSGRHRSMMVWPESYLLHTVADACRSFSLICSAGRLCGTGMLQETAGVFNHRKARCADSPGRLPLRGLTGHSSSSKSGTLRCVRQGTGRLQHRGGFWFSESAPAGRWLARLHLSGLQNSRGSLVMTGPYNWSDFP